MSRPNVRPQTEAADVPLFREEAVAEQQDRWLGTVLVVPGLSQTLVTLVVSLIVVGILSLLWFGQYTRKARIGGFLVPETGLIEIVAPQGGVLTGLPVREGQEVDAGAVLAVLSAERQSGALGATQLEVVRSLSDRRASLVTDAERKMELVSAQSDAQATRAIRLRQELEDMAAEAAVKRDRLALTEALVERRRDLRSQSLITETALFEAEKTVLDERLALQQLERQRNSALRGLEEIDAARREAPILAQQRLAEISRAIAALDQEIAEAEAQREMVLFAPQAGTVTALRASTGSTVSPSAGVMTLVPAGTLLQAELFGPSRAIGFVQPGQPVRLRYEAYPHQKFGSYDGTVLSVSHAPVAQSEGTEISTSAAGGVSEPVYRVTVSLAAQTAQAYGETARLQPGMKLEADILIETRRIYEWILDPLRSLSGGRSE